MKFSAVADRARANTDAFVIRGRTCGIARLSALYSRGVSTWLGMIRVLMGESTIHRGRACRTRNGKGGGCEGIMQFEGRSGRCARMAAGRGITSHRSALTPAPNDGT